MPRSAARLPLAHPVAVSRSRRKAARPAYMNASAEEKLAAAHVIGVDRIWDEMVSPVVS